MKSLTVQYADYIESPVTIADIAFAKAFEDKFGKLTDLDLAYAEHWKKEEFPAIRTLNIYMNGVGFEPDGEDSDVENRLEDLRLYWEVQNGLEVTWLDYINDSRDA